MAGKIKKHTDVVSSIEVFNTNYQRGEYEAPWIVYIGNNKDGYTIKYSNDENRTIENTDTIYINDIMLRLNTLEDDKVYCTQEQYDILVEDGYGWVTDVFGKSEEHVFDLSKTYYIYETDEPQTNEDEAKVE
jgi:hypothetical protein